ncbi:hypothetical protein SAMD00019534_123610, partial [Acytostelium subglobosum LB1]|uniref:hypothetical protein n=1 Tax=Acytostelium subglobosum LB1 TaxID=1410327 RepID=UPI0006447F33
MMMRIFITLLVVVITLASLASAASNCQYTSQSGDKYDFSGMVNATSYVFNSNSPKMTYYWNVCDVAHSCISMSVRTASCQISGGSWFDTGSLDQATWSDLESGKGATVTYVGDGNPCGNGVKRTTHVGLTCSNEPTAVVSATEGDIKCNYYILMTSKFACPGGGSGGSSSGGGNGPKSNFIGGGWIFIILLLVGIFLYIGIGIGVNYKVRGLRGGEMFPNIEFWSSFPGLIKDGVLYIKGKVTGSGGNGSYQQV